MCCYFKGAPRPPFPPVYNTLPAGRWLEVFVPHSQSNTGLYLMMAEEEG